MGMRSRSRTRVVATTPCVEGRPWNEVINDIIPMLVPIARRQLDPRLWKRISPSDMVQIAALEAHRKRNRFRGSTEAELKAWLRSILRCRIIEKARQQRFARYNIDLEVAITNTIVRHSDSPSEDLRKREAVVRLHYALEKISKPQREAVILCYLEEVELEQAAAIMGRRKNAVASLVCRGLDRLHELLKDGRGA